MGRRGPRPAPTALKILRGVDKKDPQRINKSEPVVDTDRPKKPRGLDKIASHKWDDLCDTLDKLGLLSTAYADSIQRYCNSWSRWIQSEQTVAKEGMYFTTEKGYMMPHPALAELHKSQAECERLTREFGLTPSAKSGVSSSKSAEKAPEWQQFLGGAKA